MAKWVESGRVLPEEELMEYARGEVRARPFIRSFILAVLQRPSGLGAIRCIDDWLFRPRKFG